MDCRMKEVLRGMSSGELNEKCDWEDNGVIETREPLIS